MRFPNTTSVLVAVFALLNISAGTVQADGWMVQGPVVYRSYYATAPVAYSGACTSAYAQTTYYAPQRYAPQRYAPQTYSSQTYAPQMYAQQSYRLPQTRLPTLPPQRPTTTAMVAAFDNYFEPKTINVQPGTTVRWVNRGRHAHTVTADDSGDIAPGASYTATFQRPGTHYYYCRHHTGEKMQGTIVVGSGGRTGYGATPREAAGAEAGRGNGYGGGSQGGAAPPRSNGAAAGRSGY
jgi:plastocyanin